MEIVPIITVCVTLLLGVAGFIINALIQRKTNSIQIITKTRLERRERTKEIASAILKISDEDYLKSINENEKSQVIKELVEYVCNLRSEYTRTFDCDIKIINIANELKRCIIEYLNSKAEIELVCKTREKFTKEIDLYIQTEWVRIKLETVGKMRNKKPSWDDLFKTNSEKYK